MSVVSKHALRQGPHLEKPTFSRRLTLRNLFRADMTLDLETSKGRLFFLVPISPPVHFEGVENRHVFFLDGRFCEQHLSERAVL